MGWVNIGLFVLSLAVLISMRPWVPGTVVRPSFVATALLAACVGITIPSFYVWLDALMGGSNCANLLLHIVLNIAFYFIGLALADAHLAPRAYRAIAGPIGWSVWVAVVLGMIVTFALSDLSASGTGLRQVPDGQLSVDLYEFLIRVYPAYVAACIVVPIAASVMNRQRSLALRVFSACMAVTFSLAFVTMIAFALPIFGMELGHSIDIPTWGAVGLFLVGSTIVFVGRLLRQRREKPDVAREYSNAR